MVKGIVGFVVIVRSFILRDANLFWLQTRTRVGKKFDW